MSRVVGRRDLLTEVAGLLGANTSVALCGPRGVGKSALLDALEEEARANDTCVLRVTASAEEAALPYTAVRDLVAQLPAELGTLAIPSPDTVTAEARSGLAAEFHAVLGQLTEERPLLLLLDDVQWLDPESSSIVGYARRRLTGMALVATVGPGDTDAIDISGLHHLDVPPLDAVDMLELLCAHGLEPDVAQRVHVQCGGIPALALALAGAIGVRPVLLGAPTPLPASVQQVLRERVAALDADVRTTLEVAALLHHPTERDLERAGRVGAAHDVQRARQAGLLAWSDGVLRLTPSALREVVLETIPARQVAEQHQNLAAVASTVAERTRHLALADPRPDAERATELALAARQAAGEGRRELAAELYLLAADRATCELAAERAEWLVSAVEAAAPGNHVEVVRRALRATEDLALSPAQAVRVRLAIPELAGAGVTVADEVLTAALTDAGDDDALVAKVLLQRARVGLMEARASAAYDAAERAVGLLEHAGDPDELALGLTTLAVASRWVGGDPEGLLRRALDLDGAVPPGFLHISPEYMQARFDLYDDRLEEAWTAFTQMLAHVERGAGADHVHVLRCLVEVAARSGRCREAMLFAERAAHIGEEFDLEGHTSWFITAQAELVGGSLFRARALAQRGAEAAGECGDVRYLLRHLIVLGQARLRLGDAEGAAEVYARIRRIEVECGVSDPTVSRWHADAVSALVALARTEEAGGLLMEARELVARRSARVGTDGVAAQLDRAEAELLVSTGELEDAELLLERAIKMAGDLGMSIDVGRGYLTRAHLERRRRRAAAARAALGEAHDLFTTLHADPWAAQVLAELSPEPVPGAGADPLLDRLTEAEARIARAVARGASNREIAERTYVSVKTVEACLTRIYRKLDVRSRTQLAALLVPAPPE